MFTHSLSVVMVDIEGRLRMEHPLTTTPASTLVDLEYAYGAVLVAGTADIAGKLLQYRGRPPRTACS